MKVKELIEALQKVDNQDAEVFYGSESEGSMHICHYDLEKHDTEGKYARPEWNADFTPKERVADYPYDEPSRLSIWLGYL
jgi:hypothetical protein